MARPRIVPFKCEECGGEFAVVKGTGHRRERIWRGFVSEMGWLWCGCDSRRVDTDGLCTARSHEACVSFVGSRCCHCPPAIVGSWGRGICRSSENVIVVPEAPSI